MYLCWDEKKITDDTDRNVVQSYDAGYVFTRLGKGLMQQTRSVRVDLQKFHLSSENKRILRKTESLNLDIVSLPLHNYTWLIGKMAQNFYAQKFGPKTFSANKIKELLTQSQKSNFNKLFVYHNTYIPVGYCIVRENSTILHYCYPFYRLDNIQKDTGLGMMIRAIMWAQANTKKYIYLGALQRPNDTYKLQFFGLEWFDGKNWQTDLTEIKNILQ